METMTLQPNLIQGGVNYPESYLKRLTAQPLNGSSIISLSGGGLQTKVDIPAGLEAISEVEVSYQLKMGGTVPTAYTLLQGNNTVPMPVLPVTYCSDFLRIEVKQADSQIPYCALGDVTKYSKETSSLFNDFNKRQKGQRFNFAYDSSVDLTINGVVPASLPSLSNLYIDTVEGTGHNTNNYQHQYIPLYDLTREAGTNILVYVPRKLSFTFKMADYLHDSIFNRLKHLPHDTNIIYTFFWNGVTDMIKQINYTMVADNVVPANRVITSITEGGSRLYSLGQKMEVSNFYLHHYAEQNPVLIDEMMKKTYMVSIPDIVPANINSTSKINACTLILTQDEYRRLYRVYTSIFMGGTGTTATRFVSDNNTNIAYQKWDGSVEFKFNNDVYARFEVGGPETDYSDSFKCYLDRFKDKSLNSGKAIEDFGTVVLDLDTDIINGSRIEYKDNILKGMALGKNINITVKFDNVKAFDGNSNYTQYMYAVVMKIGKIQEGKLAFNV